jgi:scyllo-inositol 2-dehydrogenase (NAD+)
MTKEFLSAGKHVFLEKPIAMELAEADELIALARERQLKFTIGKPVSILVSRHITRGLGQKISRRVKLSPAAMEATHALDFVLWCLEPARPVRVYSQRNYGAMAANGADIPDTQLITVTMDSGLSFVVAAGWSLPPGYPNFSTTWIEVVGTDGAVMIDDSHRDVVLNTMDRGMVLPLSTMPGEAGMVMEVYIAADFSAERNEPVSLPLPSAKPIRSVA